MDHSGCSVTFGGRGLHPAALAPSLHHGWRLEAEPVACQYGSSLNWAKPGSREAPECAGHQL